MPDAQETFDAVVESVFPPATVQRDTLHNFSYKRRIAADHGIYVAGRRPGHKKQNDGRTANDSQVYDLSRGIRCTSDFLERGFNVRAREGALLHGLSPTRPGTRW